MDVSLDAGPTVAVGTPAGTKAVAASRVATTILTRLYDECVCTPLSASFGGGISGTIIFSPGGQRTSGT